MKAPVLTWLGAILQVACVAGTSPAEHPSGAATKIFVEAALAGLDADELALVRTSDMDRIVTGNSPDVISTAGGIAEQGVPLVFDPGSPAGAQTADPAGGQIALDRLEVTSVTTNSHAVRLDMKLQISAEGQHRLTRTERVAVDQLIVWDTNLKSRAGESIVLLVQATLIDDERDLRAVLERRAAGATPTRR